MRSAPLVALALGLLLPSQIPAAAERASAAPWSAQASPKPGPARAIGSYSAGCVQGAASLPLAGDGFEVLHPGRNRYYGHPALLNYVRRLAAGAEAKGLPALLVGDLSQPRGGPTPTGHSSHQSGLDVDIAYTRPAQALWRPLDPSERERLDFVPVLDLGTGRFTADWHPRVADLLELAATDPAVDRIFVSPVVKRQLCTQDKQGAPWLTRLRPWWGHHDHFHVRLACPEGNPDCRGQEPVPPGDGCGQELAWWFSQDAHAAAQKRGQAVRPALPPLCADVLK
ncbi:MAG TPA: penicillin-insensitive murein endopeptidase [Candidatus Methylomirabilis sp.]|nr:penicillin-insensitive murein endopeptidase [Candidatus Methylomirabilis sp.]